VGTVFRTRVKNSIEIGGVSLSMFSLLPATFKSELLPIHLCTWRFSALPWVLSFILTGCRPPSDSRPYSSRNFLGGLKVQGAVWKLRGVV
jgi:hypothetical protein